LSGVCIFDQVEWLVGSSDQVGSVKFTGASSSVKLLVVSWSTKLFGMSVYTLRSCVVFGPGFHSKNWAATLLSFSSSNKNSGKAFAVLLKKKSLNFVILIFSNIVQRLKLCLL
jgi:hypothetical protein